VTKIEISYLNINFVFFNRTFENCIIEEEEAKEKKLPKKPLLFD